MFIVCQRLAKSIACVMKFNTQYNIVADTNMIKK